MGMPSDMPAVRTAGPVPQIKGRLDGIEVTQAVQDVSHSVPLVAGKTSMVRVYVSFPVHAGPAAVRGEIEVDRSDAPSSIRLTSMNAVDPAVTSSGMQRNRERIDLSLNFAVPTSLIGPGRLSVRLVRLVDVASNETLPCDGAERRADVSLFEAPPLRVRLIGLRYSTQQGQTFTPSTRDFAMIGSWLKRAYPVSDVEASQVVLDADMSWPFQCGEANAQLAALRAQDVGAGGDARTHYYGVVADGGGFMRGCASGIPTSADPTVVASGPTGSSTFGWDNDGCYGDWYAGHEIGHTFGRRHPGFCSQTSDDPAFPFPGGQLSNAEGAFVGFDAGDSALGLPMRLYPGPQSHDVMTYCNDQWLGSYTYEGIFARLAEENVTVGGSPPSAAGASLAGGGGIMQLERGDFVHVVGRVDLVAGLGKILYVTPVSTALIGGAAASGQPEVAVRVLGSNGNVLAEHAVEVKLDTCNEGAERRTGIVDVMIPKVPDATSIQLLIRGTPVDTFHSAPAAGGSRLTAMSAQAGVGEAGPAAHFSWRAEGPDASQLRYTIQASTDNGQSWQTLAVGRKTPAVSVDASQFPGAKRVKVRVLATDGFNSSEVMSDDVSLEQQ